MSKRESDGSSGVGIGSGPASSGVGESSVAVILEAARAEVTDAQFRALDAFLGRCTYTTTALMAMARWLRDLDDAEGAAMVEEFAERFAVHEAKTS